MIVDISIGGRKKFLGCAIGGIIVDVINGSVRLVMPLVVRRASVVVALCVAKRGLVLLS